MNVVYYEVPDIPKSRKRGESIKGKDQKFDKGSYDKQYAKENIKRIPLDLNRNTDADIIEHLENLPESRNRYIKRLIRADIKKKPD